MSVKEPKYLGKSIRFWLNASMVSVLSGFAVIFFVLLGGYVPGFWFGFDLSEIASRVAMTISMLLVVVGGAGYFWCRMAFFSDEHFEWRRHESGQSKKIDAFPFIEKQNNRMDLLEAMMSDNDKWIYYFRYSYQSSSGFCAGSSYMSLDSPIDDAVKLERLMTDLAIDIMNVHSLTISNIFLDFYSLVRPGVDAGASEPRPEKAGNLNQLSVVSKKAA